MDLRLPIEVDLQDDPYAAGRCYGLSAGHVVAWIAAFTTQASALTGTAPIIYTTVEWWRQCTKNTALFRNDPLWLASYDTDTPGVPSAWQQWTFWQYAEDVVVPGVGPAGVDFCRPTPALPADAGRTSRRLPSRLGSK